ncbi:MAG: YeeE/YedE thiosulfate transporter family protein [Saprospiraceae bacterium]|nr:YeeE/YedE thiosulfate transporter family protein [Saprospiraceae bacterium]MDW8484603.1 YeeE/YedE thiosulfate transporter family protein [Saprospiraceae bacterium]
MVNPQIEYQDVIPAEMDAEVRSLHAMCLNESRVEHPWYHNLIYLLVGVVFGIVLVKAEIVSWFRIQEMFRLESFHMYGVIGTAVVVGALSVFLIKRLQLRTIDGEPITFSRKTFHKGQIVGGILFGLGWAMTGACPGPLFAQIGTGATVIAVALASAIAGTWCYGYLREKLPH